MRVRSVGGLGSVGASLVLAASVLAGTARAQNADKGETVEPPPVAEQAPPETKPGASELAAKARAAAQAAGMPDGAKLNLMIRTTVIAINQANKTGNYSVLRDLATPSFQAANNPAQLAEIFADLRKRNLDLSPVLFYQPKFTSRPVLLPNGMLRVLGLFPSRPQQVHFDLAFEQIAGDWRIYSVGLGAHAAPPPGTPAKANEGAAAQVAMSTAAGGPVPEPPPAAPPTGKAVAKEDGAAPNLLKVDKPDVKIAPAASGSKDQPAAAKPATPLPKSPDTPSKAP